MKTLMRKAVVLLLLAMVAESRAQVLAQSRMSGTARYNSSIQLVPNIGVSNFKFVNSKLNLSAQPGVAAGMLVDVPTPVSGLHFESGFDYFEVESKKEDLYETEIALGYVALPLKVKYEFLDIQDLTFYGKTGASIAFLMTSKVKEKNDNGFVVESDAKEDTNKVDYLAVVGLGGETSVAGGKVNVDFDYNKGTQRTFRSAGSDEKIEGYTFRIGYSIAI